MPHALAAVSVMALAFAAVARAQCTTPWDAHGGLPGTNGFVQSMCRWDPDGVGPWTERYVFAGQFTVAGSVTTDHVASYDPATGTWSALGQGLGGVLPGNANVASVVTLADGSLVAGGSFQIGTGPTAIHMVARWDGSVWQPLGTGTDGGVTSMLPLPNGDLIVGGAFGTAGGVAVSNVARWDGTHWYPLGTGCAPVHSMALLPNGDVLVACGTGVVRWDGTSWNSLGGLVPWQSFPISVAASDVGEVFAANGDGLYRWTGSQWTIMDGDVRYITALSDGTLVGVARDGSSDLVFRVSGISRTDLFALDENGFGCIGETHAGGLVVAGSFRWFYDITTSSGPATAGVAFWNGSSVHPLTRGIEPVVFALAGSGTASASTVTAGCSGISPTGIPSELLQASSDTWMQVGPGRVVYAVTSGPTGVTWADVNRVYRRTPSGTVTSLGTQVLNGAIYALLELPNGDVIAGGNFTAVTGALSPRNRIARWDGTAWYPMNAGMNSDVYALAFIPNAEAPGGGTLVAAGNFSTAGSAIAPHIAAWSGSDWYSLGGLDNTAHSLCVTTDGDLIAGGIFTSANGVPAARVARMDSLGWHACGAGTSGPVFALTPLPSGGFVAGGLFATAGGLTVNNLARCDGAAWSAFGSGTDAAVMALTTLPNGDVYAGGYFTTVDGVPSHHIARITTTCPADIVSYGMGCSGPGGTLSLGANKLPWTGATFEVAASGLGPASFGLVMLSFGQLQPGVFPIHPNLLGVVPGPGIGCDLLVASLDYNTGLTPFAGTATWALPLAPVQVDPSLPGLTFYLQVAELDFSAGWVGTYMTNALSCTVGTF